MKRIVECARCGIERFAYESEPEPIYCETQRCEKEERPGTRRQTDHQAAPTNNLEEEVDMSQNTPNYDELDEYLADCPGLEHSEHQCETTRLSRQLTVATQACQLKSTIRLKEVFQHGQQVHAVSLEILDEMNHDAVITLYPQTLVSIAEWLIEHAHSVIPTSKEAAQ